MNLALGIFFAALMFGLAAGRASGQQRIGLFVGLGTACALMVIKLIVAG